MSYFATLGGTPCPACGATLDYSTFSPMPITEVKCEQCHKEWQIITLDGETKVEPKKRQ